MNNKSKEKCSKSRINRAKPIKRIVRTKNLKPAISRPEPLGVVETYGFFFDKERVVYDVGKK